MITLNQYYRKIVVTFTSNKSINAVRNMVKNKIEPKIDQALINEFGGDMTNLVIEHKNKVTEFESNKFEIYPKTVISGDFNGTLQVFELRIDALINQLKTELGNEIQVFGGTIILNGFHIHRTTGSSDEN